MSVYTDADRKYEELKDRLDGLHKELYECGGIIYEIFSPNTWGYDSYSQDFMDKLLELQFDLFDMSRKIAKFKS